MRKEDREIKYRPGLAEILQNDLNFMKSYYSKNFPQMYYKVLSILYGSEKNKKGEKLFDMVAGWYEHPYEVLEMFSEYRRELAEFDVYEPISDARAFCILNEIYDKEFKARKDLVDRKDLTKMESFMVDDFYGKCFSPLRNPNIQIKDGEAKCYYDKQGHYGEFERDLKNGVEYLTNECNRIIEIFNMQD